MIEPSVLAIDPSEMNGWMTVFLLGLIFLGCLALASFLLSFSFHSFFFVLFLRILFFSSFFFCIFFSLFLLNPYLKHLSVDGNDFSEVFSFDLLTSALLK